MEANVHIPHLEGKWKAPASKSELIRFIAIAMQCEQESRLSNITWCNDSFAMINIAEAWGAEIKLWEENILIKGCKKPKSQRFNVGESALCLRLLIPILSLHPETYMIEVEGTLQKRPLGEIVSILQQHGVQIEKNSSESVIIKKGVLSSGHISIEHPISSQNISGLLFALPLLNGNSQIKINKLISLPYIQLSLSCLSQAKINIDVNDNYSLFSIQGNQLFQSIIKSIEGDWSAASLLFAAAAIAGNIEIENLNPHSLQADRAISTIVSHQYKNRYIVKSQAINEFNIDITHCPDLFPALMILALHACSTSKISGINRLLFKESNRLETFMEEFGKLGAKFTLKGDLLTISPPEKISSATINSHNDHRIAMACALAITGTDAEVSILNAECVNKSYPSFWEDLKCLGAKIHETI